MYRCALGTIKTKEDLSAYYHQKRKEGKKHKIVMNALANKILQQIWSVIANEKEFEKRMVEFEKYKNQKKAIISEK